LLLDTDMRISDIAANVGFTSASYYITRFKQQIGLSPIKYRAQIR
jgi:AraC-like DNA-binding protein